MEPRPVSDLDLEEGDQVYIVEPSRFTGFQAGAIYTVTRLGKGGLLYCGDTRHKITSLNLTTGLKVTPSVVATLDAQVGDQILILDSTWHYTAECVYEVELNEDGQKCLRTDNGRLRAMRLSDMTEGMIIKQAPKPKLAPGTVNTPDPKAPHSGNPKDLIGVTKPSVHLAPFSAILHMNLAMEDGAIKYGPYNWRQNPVKASVYYNAAMRHLAQWFDGEERARDSGVNHLGHAMACLAIILDAQHQGCLLDDRPSGMNPLDNVIEEMTAFKKAKAA